MPNLSTGNLINAVSPSRYEDSVATNTVISVTFSRDVDQATLSQATIALEIVGTVIRVPVTFTYANRILSITPTGGLSPNTSYKLTLVGDVNPQLDVQTINISGIRDIAGNGLIGEWTTMFTTGTTGTDNAPVAITPSDESSIPTQPTFSWTPVTNATLYELQVSKDNTFENIFWPTYTSTWDQTQTSVRPDLPFDVDQEYFWRVRAVNGTTLGAWSGASNFYYGDPTEGSVTPDDEPLGLIPPTDDLVRIISATPAPNTDNIQPSDFPNTILVTIQGQIDPSNVNSSTFWVEGDPIDGEFQGGDFKPIFAPSLNGAQFGSGGITVPAPVDAYQQILVSGNLNTEPPSVNYDGASNTSVLSLPVPGGYFQDNNLYTVHLNLPELSEPIFWTFSTRWFPVFASVISVRRMVNHFLPELSDQDIWATIRKNSLNAVFLQTYPPTQVDAESWIYNPPISFNVNNPPFFVREYVRIQTCLDFLRDLLHQAIRGGKTQLGDFSVDQESAATKGMLELACARLEKELAPFLDKLHGHTNRGYARGEWAQRGEQYFGNDNPLRNLPFALNKRGPNFNW